jgi:CRISPR-associated protein Csd1
VLSDTYDRCRSEVGVVSDGSNGKRNKSDKDGSILLPIAHSTANAQIEIKLDMDGTFISAAEVGKEDALTVIPVTEDSATRSSGIAPHPLCDKLCYIAGDYDRYVKSDKAGKGKEEYYRQYISALEQWSQRTQAGKKVKAIYQYLIGGNTIKDLVESKVLQTDEDGYINNIKVEGISQGDAFVRFIVINSAERLQVNEVWKDRELFREYEDYYMEQKEQLKSNLDLCYVMGELLPYSDKHPAKIRHTGDKSKIISANDKGGFTFRGRFAEAKQAVSVSFVASQKAHNALRWLIKKQGYYNEGEVIVSWCIEGINIPSPLADSYDLAADQTDDVLEEDRLTKDALAYETVADDTLPDDDLPDDDLAEDEVPVDTGLSYAVRFNRAMAGYSADLDTGKRVVVMAVDTADGSGQGRLSITFYGELDGSAYINNLNKWHNECRWRHTYKKVADKKYVQFTGAPSPREIALTAYGVDQEGLLKADEKVIKACVKRLLPCIIYGSDLPWDIMQSMVKNTGRPMSLSRFNFSRMLSNTCAVIVKYKKNKHGQSNCNKDKPINVADDKVGYKQNEQKEEWGMALNENIQERSYLFGRLLAIAERAEIRTYDKKEDGGRWTNAKRYWSVFSKQPAKIWHSLAEKLIPYLMKLKYPERIRYEELIQGICSRFLEGDFSNKPLTENYLLGYYCQLEDLRYKDKNENNDENTNSIKEKGDNEDE